MKALLALFFLALSTFAASIKAEKLVFAHHVAGVAVSLTPENWRADMQLAKAHLIDGFALNIASGDPNNEVIINNAFNAADAVGFKMFFSFDYASRGAWAAGSVIDYINRFKGRASYYKIDVRPYVSTFEGPGNANDWYSIKGATNCYFVPDWTSIGPDGFRAHLDKVDGAFNWNIWPEGPRNLGTSGDEAWRSVLAGRHYLMGVSPWFYTSLPQWNKNWLWRGDNLWHYRWEDIIRLQPSMVEIVTWNDFGESHYIGPLYPAAFPAGANYCNDMPHQAWLKLLPNYIARYKGIAVPAGNDKIVVWYKRNYGQSCGTGGTTGNNVAYQPFYQPYELQEEKIFVTVLLNSAAQVTVQVGSAAQQVFTANQGGVFHFDAPKNGALGAVVVRVVRNGAEITRATGATLTNDCPLGHVNWNAWVGEN
ncbi:hypothetical protein Poli38472_008775 [Pythium oligandrum]|uniref:Uncharacterized protein n=1 Tax=Pythium oligandrum TaxID=41045 RepID=A0A8K1C4T3_PYTOL|nr:hypothetical protein Poli38472_008775 [Pythium oligandrum]|eukprot:TMW56127.1 hypothetical protein Poli38472_008775 [Pythium oligandrum]